MSLVTGPINRLATFCMLSHGWVRAFLLIFAGALGGLAMPPFYFLPALFVAMPILVWCLDGAETFDQGWSLFGVSFRIGYFFGLGYFVSSLHWLGAAFFVDGGVWQAVAPFAVLGLSAFLALFWGAAARTAHLFWGRGIARIFVLAASFGLLELMRGIVLTGFAFNQLGVALTANPQMMQLLSIVGVDGLTPLVVLIAAMPALTWPKDEAPLIARLAPLFLAFALIGAQLAYGQFRLDTTEITEKPNIDLRLVQPVVDQKEKWLPHSATKIEEQLISLSATQTSPTDLGLIGTTHLFWPEAALPFFLQDSPITASHLARLLPPGTNLLTGMPRRFAPDGINAQSFNSIIAFDHNAEIAGTYDKVHLVPFGEYIPFDAFLRPLGLSQIVPGNEGWSRGETRRLLSAGNGLNLLPLICYEVIFSHELRDLAASADAILNVTNDAWFDGSIGPIQHFHHAKLRAVEYGLPIIRVANSGHSAIIDPLGNVLEYLPQGEIGLIDAKLPDRPTPTPYQHLGIFAPLAIIAFFGILGLILGRKARR